MNWKKGFVTVKGLVNDLANSFRVHLPYWTMNPGRCPGLKFANAFGVSNEANDAEPSVFADAFFYSPFTIHHSPFTIH